MANTIKYILSTMIILISIVLMSIVTYADEPKETQTTTMKTTNFLYGVGLSSSSQIYKGYGQRTMLLPLIGYKSERLSIFGPFISYKVKEFNDFTFSMKLSPRFQGYDESDSDIFKGMKKRKSSLDAGFDVSYKKDDWTINVSSMFDTLSRSNGYEIKSVINRMFRVGPIFIQPSVSFSFLDSRLVDYYYGASENEVNPFRNAYMGQSSRNTAIGLSVSTPIFFGGYTRMKIEQLWFDSNITNSPLVDGNSSLSFQLFFTKIF